MQWIKTEPNCYYYTLQTVGNNYNHCNKYQNKQQQQNF